MSALDAQNTVPVVVALCTSRADALQVASEGVGRVVTEMSGYWLVAENGEEQ